LLVAALALATVALALVSNGDPAVTLAPVLLVGLLYAIWHAPLRLTAIVLIFALIGIDDDNTALGLWHTPWSIINELLVYNIDRTIPAAHGFKLSGLELLLLLCFGIAVHRRATGSRVDSRGREQTARVMVEFALVYLLAIAYAVTNGMLRGGSTDIAIWQARPLLHLVLLFFLFKVAFPGARDYRVVGRVVVAAALGKAILALWVYGMFARQGQALACATSHGDSFLFVMGCVMLITNFLERTDRFKIFSLLPVALLFAGMWANNRRLAWVQLGLTLVALFLLSKNSPWKRKVARTAMVVLPVLALYVGAGWNSQSSVFAPVKMARSVSDTKGDRSTYFRQVENFNLGLGMTFSPIRGVGFGHEFAEYYPMDDITSMFPQYHAEPHNQVLGLLLFAGLLGFAGVWSFYGMGIFLAARSYRFATTPPRRVAAMCGYATILVGLMDAYGDLGPYNIQHQVLMALALALIGKLAVVTGAWPARQRTSSLAIAPGDVDSVAGDPLPRPS
jgi:O-antigen ligase